MSTKATHGNRIAALALTIALCLSLFAFTGTAVAENTALTATPSSTAFTMSGRTVSVPEAYAINGNNYLQLRGIAALLNGTAAQFDVSWDGTYAVIETGKPYTGTATPATLAETTNVRKSTTQFKIDGTLVSFENAYYIDGDTNYLQLREFAEKLSATASKFNVYWDSTAGQAVIEPGTAYTGTAPATTPETTGWEQYNNNPRFANFIYNDTPESELPFTTEQLASDQLSWMTYASEYFNSGNDGNVLATQEIHFRYSYFASFWPDYDYSLESVRKELRNELSVFRSGISYGVSEEERINYILSYMKSQFKYEITTIPVSNFQTIVHSRVGQCQDWADAFCVYAASLGLDAIAVFSKPGNHAWNLVKCTDKWYFVEPQLSSGGTTDSFKATKYSDGHIFGPVQYNVYGVYTQDGEPLSDTDVSDRKVMLASTDFTNTYGQPIAWGSR